MADEASPASKLTGERKNRQLKNQRNIVDNLKKVNMKLRLEKQNWKDLYYLRDRDGFDNPQFVKHRKANN